MALNEIFRNGYSAHQLLEQILEEFISDSTLSDKHKIQICYQCAMVESALLDGASEELQLRSFFSFVLALTYKG